MTVNQDKTVVTIEFDQTPSTTNFQDKIGVSTSSRWIKGIHFQYTIQILQTSPTIVTVTFEYNTKNIDNETITVLADNIFYDNSGVQTKFESKTVKFTLEEIPRIFSLNDATINAISKSTELTNEYGSFAASVFPQIGTIAVILNII